MKQIKETTKIARVVVLILCIYLSAGAVTDDGNKKSANAVILSTPEFYVFDINNIHLPINNRGVLADVDDGNGAGARYDGKLFLFSGGFFLSGYSNGNMWSNGVLSAARIEDYNPGPVGSDPTDPKNRVYVVSVGDEPFGTTWQEWRDAVSIGADFYDGDGDGKYDPIDRNGDSKWSSDEDRPDLLGDVTAWCVFNDGVPKGLRRFNDVEPQGIEIHQTVFGYRSAKTMGNMLFIRYRIVNKGTVTDLLDSVYFAVAADPDLGDAGDDLVGCDSTLSAGYTYNKGPDALFGTNSPAFLMNITQGPPVYIPGETFVDANGNGFFDTGESPLLNAQNVKGTVKGIEVIPGAKNIGMTSFQHYMMSATGTTPNTRFALRNQLKGLESDGSTIDPCTWSFGNGPQKPDECGFWDPKYKYSGDPVTGTGWINTTAIDQRVLVNTGSFIVRKNQPVDIYVSYIIGRDPTLSLKSIDGAKQYSEITSSLFEQNFPQPTAPPGITVDARTGDGIIELTWNTAPLFNYRKEDTTMGYDKRFHAFYVTAYRTNNKNDKVSGIWNKSRIGVYIRNNQIQAIKRKIQNGAVRTYLEWFGGSGVLDTIIYANPDEGRIRLRLNGDKFSNYPYVKGKEYYYTVTAVLLDHAKIKNILTNTYGPAGDYIDEYNSAIEEYESEIIRVIYETDQVNPAQSIVTGVKKEGFASGSVKVLSINNDELTGDSYTVQFKSDTSVIPYLASYSLTNNRTNEILIADSKNYNDNLKDFSGKVTEGFVLRVSASSPQIHTPEAQFYYPASNRWFDFPFQSSGYAGAWYMGNDIAGASGTLVFPGKKSTITKANRIRAIEIRFSQPGKAYRYMNGFVGASPITRIKSYQYAAGINSTDTSSTRGGSMGKFGEGYVDVPFQVWIKDDVYGEERQLAVGFAERSASITGGKPDGIWHPGMKVVQSLEAIIIFDAPYDPSGSQIEYTGGMFTDGTVWADLRGFHFPAGATYVTDEQKRIAASPMFNALYVVGFDAYSPESTFKIGDIYKVPVTNYPYTDTDVFTFSTKAGGTLTHEEQKSLFEQVNVFPNPIFIRHSGINYYPALSAEDPFVTFSNLPEVVTIKIYSVSGALVRTLTQEDKWEGANSSLMQWNLLNDHGRRIASGMYLAVVSAPGFGEKLLKLGVVLPQK